ncbi:MET1 (YKR069W) [Zygosaccharomyces parabailii]|nr:MET1 (YKR069W) [Zygosaccharomyces parabailii]
MIDDSLSLPLPLLVACDCRDEVQLVIGTNPLGACKNRIKSILRSGANAIVLAPTSDSDIKQLFSNFGSESRFQIINRSVHLSDLTTLGRPLVAKVVDRVFVQLPMEQCLIAKEVYTQCVKLRIPINTFQRPEYSTFHMGSTYVDPEGSGLQISVSTNGQGCILANRIKREVIAALPKNISQIVSNMGRLRDQVINEDQKKLLHQQYHLTQELAVAENVWYGLTGEYESHKLNKLIKEFDMSERDQKLKRTRWLSQLIEYYPLSKLADVSLAELGSQPTEQQKSDTPNNIGKEPPILKGSDSENATAIQSDSNKSDSRGSISLVGSGPGSISMLTLGALQEIKTADLVLADKLVPQAVLDLIPSSTETFIARKFPGNAERAQQELLEKGLESAKKGLKVVRLKQGDPYIFGRGGEEYTYFSQHGFEPVVLPGLSSALASTVVSRIPATQRNVADQVLVCTGTGRKGALPQIPEYVTSRTTIFLMALHRADVLVRELLNHQWDPKVPVAIVERASCPDQRVTRTQLKYVSEVVEEIGSRPPGLLVVGHSVAALLPDKLIQFNDSHKYSIEEGYQATEPVLSSLLN